MPRHEDTLDTVPELCLKTFLTLERSIIIMYIAAGIFVSACTTSVVWAFSVDHKVTVVEQKGEVMQSRLDMMDREIMKKLDTLIERGRK